MTGVITPITLPRECNFSECDATVICITLLVWGTMIKMITGTFDGSQLPVLLFHYAISTPHWSQTTLRKYVQRPDNLHKLFIRCFIQLEFWMPTCKRQLSRQPCSCFPALACVSLPNTAPRQNIRMIWSLCRFYSLPEDTSSTKYVLPPRTPAIFAFFHSFFIRLS